MTAFLELVKALAIYTFFLAALFTFVCGVTIAAALGLVIGVIRALRATLENTHE